MASFWDTLSPTERETFQTGVVSSNRFNLLWPCRSDVRNKTALLRNGWARPLNLVYVFNFMVNWLVLSCRDGGFHHQSTEGEQKNIFILQKYPKHKLSCWFSWDHLKMRMKNYNHFRETFQKISSSNCNSHVLVIVKDSQLLPHKIFRSYPVKLSEIKPFLCSSFLDVVAILNPTMTFGEFH